jgi:enoyl-CoA hydratase/carnithine racemase
MLPAAGGSQTIPRTVGRSRALEALLSNERMDAAKALDIGLVHRVVPRETLLDEAQAQARQLASYPAHLLKTMKEALLRGLDMPLERALEMETSLAATAIATR